jgi:hypothetical protein
MYAAVTETVNTLWGKIRKYKSKVEKLRRTKTTEKPEIQDKQGNDKNIDEPFTMRDLIDQSCNEIKHKKVYPGIMSAAEAAAAIELIGHSFYIFRNILK